MAKTKGGLGKGLAALIPDWDLEAEEDFHIEGIDEEPAPADIPQSGVTQVPVASIRPNPWQPRRHFDEEELTDLTESIRQQGVLSPILVMEEVDGFILVSGERRFRAAQRAGLTHIPALVRAFTNEEMAQIALIENIQRSDLLPLEEARGYQHLMAEYGHTPQGVAELVGKSRSHVANMVRLLQLPEDIQALLDEGTLTAGHARALLALDDPLTQAEIAKDITDKGLSVRAVEQLIQAIKEIEEPKPQEESRSRRAFRNDNKWKTVSDQMTQQLQTQVRIRGNGRNGRLEIAFYGEEDLQRILDALNIQCY